MGVRDFGIYGLGYLGVYKWKLGVHGDWGFQKEGSRPVLAVPIRRISVFRGLQSGVSVYGNYQLSAIQKAKLATRCFLSLTMQAQAQS